MRCPRRSRRRPGSSWRRMTCRPRSRSSASSASVTCWRRCSSAAGCRTCRCSRVPASDGGARARARSPGSSARSRLIERHIARRQPDLVHGDYDVDGVCSTAIAGPRAARARRRRRLVPARPVDRRLRPRARRPSRGSPRGGTACSSPSTARSPPSTRSPPRGRPGSTWSSRPPRAARGRAPAGLRRRPPGAVRLSVPGSVRDRVADKLAPRRGTPARRREREATSSSSRSRRSPIWCRCGARTAGSCARACARSPRTTRPGLRALMSVARVDPRASMSARSASAWRRGSTRPGASTGPTPRSSCC